MEHTFTYAGALDASERVQWRVEDLIGGDKRLDFERPFLPESLARTDALTFLTAAEKRTLNQIRGNAYLGIFGLVEEFILPFLMDHARTRLADDDHRARALLNFASEEAKHIHLFHRFQEEFAAGFGTACDVIGPAQDIARAVLNHPPIGVALAILHIEWMTQKHYTESVRDNGDLDPQFKSLLRHHWMEESQHAKLDTLIVEALAEAATPEQIDRGIDAYLDIGGFLDEGLFGQMQLDAASFERARGRSLADDERQVFYAVQRQANRWTYLGSGMSHPNFLSTVEKIRPGARARLEAVVPTFL